MKIDIHTHTLKCKTGDAAGRQITAAGFCEAVQATDVGIVAITNHNVFDLGQYNDIVAGIGEGRQVWPGVELDVLAEGVRGHLIVIVSPTKAVAFAENVADLTRGVSPDDFETTVEKILRAFDDMGPLYVAHYKQKQPSLPEKALDDLLAGTAYQERVLKEVTNAISAGIYISHGHASIYGSDHHDWADYSVVAESLPDLRLPVDGYEHFCLLLAKDAVTINTALDRKTSEFVTLCPFDDGTEIELKVFNDINVVFGPKGTGKSCILEAIAKYYSDAGIDAKVFLPASDRLEEIYDIKGRDLSLNLQPLGIDYCKDDIERIRQSSEVNVTSLSKYVAHFKADRTNRNAKKIKLKDLQPEDDGDARRRFEEIEGATAQTKSYLSFIRGSRIIREAIGDDELESVVQSLELLLVQLELRRWDTFSSWKQTVLMNSAIAKVRTEVERKTGSPALPVSTGFKNYATNRARIHRWARNTVRAFETKILRPPEPIGHLGGNKGTLELCTEFQFQSGDVIDASFQSLQRVKKGSQKAFAKAIRRIAQSAYSDGLFKHITDLNAIEDVEAIETVYELLLFKRYFTVAGNPYEPSSGEASMVMLHKELETDKDVYILDEPERSLGNEYISEVIVPMLRERARIGKRIFISTHDANVAVRTLPYSSIYRFHNPDGYHTYAGNPFTNDLVNIEDAGDRLDWKKISMQTLEGGELAFGERGRIYGNR